MNQSVQTVNQSVYDAIVSRDISKFQTLIPLLKNRSGNFYLSVFVESFDTQSLSFGESHEYILSSILKLQTKFKPKYIHGFLKHCVLHSGPSRSVHSVPSMVKMLVSMIKRIQITDQTIYTVLKTSQRCSLEYKKYLISELLTVLSYFSLYEFIKLSDLDTCWMGILTRNVITQEELDYYACRLKDTQLLYKLQTTDRERDLRGAPIWSIDVLIKYHKLKSCKYLLHSGINIQKISISSIKELCNLLTGTKINDCINIINKIIQCVSVMYANKFLMILITNLQPGDAVRKLVIKKCITVEYLNNEKQVKQRIVHVCSKYLTKDIAQYMILKYLFYEFL